MKQEFPVGTWIRVKVEKFDDEMQIPIGKIGRYLGHDGWLPILWSFPNHRWPIRPFYLERLNGQLEFFGAGQDILLVLELFYKSALDVGLSEKHLSQCFDLLVGLTEALSEPCPLAASELEMAIVNLEHYRSDRWKNHKSGVFFFEHMCNAISFMLGLS